MIHPLIEKFKTGKQLTAKETGLLVDLFKTAEAARLKADKDAAALKLIEVEFKEVLIASLKSLEVPTIGGKQYTVDIKQVDEPTVESWDKFYAHIIKTKDFSLLERRPGKAAIKERWEDGKTVPGVSKFPVDKLSFSKVKE
jgi:hypothetical protein